MVSREIRVNSPSTIRMEKWGLVPFALFYVLDFYLLPGACPRLFLSQARGQAFGFACDTLCDSDATLVRHLRDRSAT